MRLVSGHLTGDRMVLCLIIFDFTLLLTGDRLLLPDGYSDLLDF